MIISILYQRWDQSDIEAFVCSIITSLKITHEAMAPVTSFILMSDPSKSETR